MAKDIELKTGIEEYISSLNEDGRKKSTVKTAGRSLALLEADLGAAKIIDKIMPMHIAVFFKSDAALNQPTKDGTRPRAEASILQIRRIIRSALVWWHEKGYCDTIPIPKEERRFLRDANDIDKKKGVKKTAKKKGRSN